MENFTFYNPVKYVFGKGKIAEIGRYINEDNNGKVLIIAGRGSIKRNGVYNIIINSLKQHNIDWIEKWDVRPNPILSHALETINSAREFGADAILAVGGGSVIDEAKAVAAGYFYDNIWDAYTGDLIVEKALPIYTVLTMSGTCSEMDAFSVLTNEDEKKKWAFGNRHTFPKVSIVDPEVQYSLPWEQTVNGGIDAMSHILEFYFRATDQEITLSVNEANLKTIELCLDNLKKDEQDYNSRANLAWCSTIALNGISAAGISRGEFAAHRIEHGISAVFQHVAHGAGLAVVFPAWIQYTWGANKQTYLRWAKNVWDADTIPEAVEKMRSKFKSWGAPVTLADLGISETAINEISDNILQFDTVGNMVRLDINDIVNILKMAV